MNFHIQGLIGVIALADRLPKPGLVMREKLRLTMATPRQPTETGMSEPANNVIAMDIGAHLVEIEPTGQFTGAVTVRLRYQTGDASAAPAESRLYTFSLEGARQLAKGLEEAALEASKLRWHGPSH